MIPGAGPVWRCLTQVQQALTTESANSNPTILILQAEKEFASVNRMPFHSVVHVFRLSNHWLRKRLWFPVKGKRSNGRLADIPLCRKWRRMIRADTE
ncbi:hypothetical protein TNCV_3049961 [Trichonephila clavipes]|nr:hypothetical protein TNCV_3049961 [Trichonephila clavipes]